MSKLQRNVGNWVEGKDFWDRERELKNLIELLQEDANVLITAPRRIGKTSLIRETARRMDNKYICLLIDLQKCDSPVDAVTELSIATKAYKPLWNKTKETFENILKTVKGNVDTLGIDKLSIKLRDSISNDWKTKGNQICDIMSTSGIPVIIFLDEFPLLVNRLLKGPNFMLTPERLSITEEFLSWIRAITIQYKKKLRLVITGSIGLEPILRQAGLSSTMNTFTPFEITSWDRKTASGCLQALANNYGLIFEDQTKDKIIDLIECCIPHHVQMFFSYIYDDCKRRNNMKCKPKDAERIYNASMLSTRGHAELSTYEERLKVVLGENTLPLALELLTEAAVTGKLTTQTAKILLNDFPPEKEYTDDTLREVLSILEHDGYLKKKEKHYVFISKLVRDWRKGRFEFLFTTASKREKSQ